MEHFRGDIYSILTACAWSIAVIFFKLSGDHLATVPLKVFQNTVAVLLFFATMIVIGAPLQLDLSAAQWWRVVISAFVGITLGDTLFIAAINRLGASMQAIVDGLYMPFVMTMAYMFFGETVSSQVLLGAGFVVVAIVLAQVGFKREKSQRRELWSGLGLAVLSQVCLAGCVVLVKDLLQTQPLLTLTAYRFAIGTVTLVIFYLLKGHGRSLFVGFKPSPVWKITFTGAFLGPYLATLFWFSGFKYTLAGKAAVYNQLSTIFIVILAAIFLGERLTRFRVAAILIAIFGSYMVLTG